MKTLKIGLLACLLPLLMAGCAFTGATVTANQQFPAVSPDQVQILFEKPTQPYQVLGRVTSHANLLVSQDYVIKSLQKEASKLGAQAIIVGGVQDTTNVFESYQQGTALAIRWQ